MEKPKTHSDILWHFTGGSKWNSTKQNYYLKLKTQKESYDIAIKILSSKVLKLGNYHEKFIVSLPNYEKIDKKSKEKVKIKNKITSLDTSKVCCLADIPRTELFHHAKRYGNMAIGFKRESVIKNSFNPVFYTLNHKEIANKFFAAQGLLKETSLDLIQAEVDDLSADISNQLCSRCESEVSIDDSNIISQTETDNELIESSLQSLQYLLSYVKTFKENEFETIYAEREWRSLQNFNFNLKDIHSILFPNKNLLNNFILNYKSVLKIPSSVSLEVF